MKKVLVSVLSFAFIAATAGSALAAGNKAEGAKVYKQQCAACHGDTGKGDGPSAKSLKPAPTNLTDAKLMSSLSDADIAKVTKEGGAKVGKSPLMPALGATWNKQQMDDMVAHMRDLCKCKGKK